MTEEEAKYWIRDRYGADAVDRLGLFASMVQHESGNQNLVSAASLPEIWTRHIVDSAQLLALAPAEFGTWVDVGTGAGFPGIVLGALTDKPVILVEPRKRRVDFLLAATESLQLTNTTVRCSKAEALVAKADVISARAVSRVAALLDSTIHLAHPRTIWILPKGRNAHEEVAQARNSWQGTFHVEQSVTDPTSLIVIASGIARR